MRHISRVIIEKERKKNPLRFYSSESDFLRDIATPLKDMTKFSAKED